MPQVEDLTITITADTTQAMRSLKRLSRQLWWMRYGYVVTAVALCTMLFAAGFVVGRLV